jgi:hypothetical protein
MFCAWNPPGFRSWLFALLAGVALLTLCARGQAAEATAGDFDSLVAHGAALGGVPVLSGPSLQPETVINPFPANGATNVPVDVILSWVNNGGATGYRVFFGTTLVPPPVGAVQAESVYSPGTLQFSTTYHWRINAVDGTGVDAVGPVWSFRTGVPGVATITSLDATDGIFTDRVRVSWTQVTSATAYRVSRALLPLGPKTVVRDWAPAATFDDLNVVPGETYYYWAQSSTDGGVTNVSAYSPMDAGFSNPNGQQTYKVTTKNCHVDLDLSGRMLVTSTDTVYGCSVKVTRFGGQAVPPLATGPTTMTAPVFFIRSTVHPGAVITGNVAQFITQLPMKSLTVSGDLRSLSGYVERVSAQGVGRVAMSVVQDPALIDAHNGPYVFIESPVNAVTQMRASVALAGLTLVKFSLPNQEVTSVKVLAKKGHGPALKRFVSGGNVGVAGLGDETFDAGALGKLSVQSGSLLSQTVVTHRALRPTTISTRGFVFTAVSTTGTQTLQVHRGDILPTRITSVSPLLNVTARGGNILPPLLETSSAIGTLAANSNVLRLGGGAFFYGGALGTTTTQIVVMSGENNVFQVSADMGNVFGATGVNGSFFAGVKPSTGTLVANYAGNIGSIKTAPLQAGATSAPVIAGFATVQDGTQLRAALAGQGNAPAFVVFDLAAPKP